MFLGCASKPIKVDMNKIEGFWQSKVLLKDFKKNRTTLVDVNFNAIKNEKLRADITATMGYNVAILQVDSNQFQLLVHSQKKAYIGRASEKSLYPVLGIDLDPRILFYLLFDESLPQKNWTCNNDESGLPLLCNSNTGAVSVRWSERKGESKKITMNKTGFEMQIFIKNYETKVQSPELIFKTKIPDSYTTHQLD